MRMGKIIKPKRFDNYVVVPLPIFRYKGISASATGVYCWLLSHKSDIEMTQEFMVGHFKNGRAAIRSAIEELESHGFLKRIKHRVGSKDIYDYVISEHVLEGEKWEFENGHPKMGVRKSASQNRTQRYNINKVINNKEIPEEVKTAFPHIVSLFPKKFQPQTEPQKLSWLKEVADIHRLDGVEPKVLYRLVENIRNDAFWGQNFLTLMKLRKKNKEGIKYLDMFFEKFGTNLKKHLK